MMRVFWWAYWPFAVLAMAYLAACGLAYEDPVRYSVAEVRTPFVQAGDTFRVYFEYQRERVCELDRTRIIIDGQGGWHEVGRDHLPAVGLAGRGEILEVRIPIEGDFLPGLSAYRVILAYQCPLHLGPFTVPNLFQEFSPKTLVLEDLRFTILPKVPRPDAPHHG